MLEVNASMEVAKGTEADRISTIEIGSIIEFDVDVCKMGGVNESVTERRVDGKITTSESGVCEVEEADEAVVWSVEEAKTIKSSFNVSRVEEAKRSMEVGEATRGKSGVRTRVLIRVTKVEAVTTSISSAVLVGTRVGEAESGTTELGDAEVEEVE